MATASTARILMLKDDTLSHSSSSSSTASADGGRSPIGNTLSDSFLQWQSERHEDIYHDDCGSEDGFAEDIFLSSYTSEEHHHNSLVHLDPISHSESDQVVTSSHHTCHAIDDFHEVSNDGMDEGSDTSLLHMDAVRSPSPSMARCYINGIIRWSGQAKYKVDDAGCDSPPERNEFMYREFLKAFHQHIRLIQEVECQVQEKSELQVRIAERHDFSTGQGGAPKKRIRRTAMEIERRFRCPVIDCNKGYGAEATLLQHIRRKHPQCIDRHSENLKQAHAVRHLAPLPTNHVSVPPCPPPRPNGVPGGIVPGPHVLAAPLQMGRVSFSVPAPTNEGLFPIDIPPGTKCADSRGLLESE